jgi:hypothetical protein
VRLQPRGPGLLVAAHLREQLAAGGVVDVVTVEFCGQLVELAQGRLRACDAPDRERAVDSARPGLSSA